MNVVITGGCGFLGLALARALLARDDVERIVLADLGAAPDRVGDLASRVDVVDLDVADAAAVREVVAGGGLSVFHLASVVSAGAEQDFDLALRVNLDGGRNVLDACRAAGPRTRVVIASTQATYGGSAMPETVGDDTRQVPQTTYGMTKRILELLVNDYTRKGFLDGRGARLPTVIVRPGAPNAAASGFASAVFREPLAGVDTTLPVPLDIRMTLIGARTAVACLVALGDLEPDRLGDDRTVNLPSLSATVEEMVAAVRRVGADRRLGAIDVRPDPRIEAICRTWPQHARAERATALGLPRDVDLDAIVRAYVEDHLS